MDRDTIERFIMEAAEVEAAAQDEMEAAERRFTLARSARLAAEEWRKLLVESSNGAMQPLDLAPTPISLRGVKTVDAVTAVTDSDYGPWSLTDLRTKIAERGWTSKSANPTETVRMAVTRLIGRGVLREEGVGRAGMKFYAHTSWSTDEEEAG